VTLQIDFRTSPNESVTELPLGRYLPNLGASRVMIKRLHWDVEFTQILLTNE
jgi:hypothetical protein